MAMRNEQNSNHPMKSIHEVTESIGLAEEDLEFYGRYKAKGRLEAIRRRERCDTSSLILVSAMTPTPAGEGKTTVFIGLAHGSS